MSRLSIATIERYAKDFRVNYIGTDLDSPINIKTVLTKLGVLALFRPLSEGLCGLSIRSTTDDRFMLINSNNNIGRQHFTVAHELYHLYYGTNTVPHICRLGGKEPEEVNADSFASALLMPEKGLIQQLPGEEYRSGKISMATLLRTERVFGVSHDALLIRLLKLHIINSSPLLSLPRQHDTATIRLCTALAITDCILEHWAKWRRRSLIGERYRKATILKS